MVSMNAWIGGMALALAMPAAHALDIPVARRLAAANACMGCHAVNRKVVGPSFRQVAAKYQGDAGALATLVKKVKLGGAGVWGQLPMPSHPRLSDADARTLVEWVLAGAPAK